MESGTPPDRLSQFSTRWSVVQQAHDGTAEQAAAREEVLARYGGAVYRYLLGALRDTHAAEDLAQEFALKFLRGEFHRADALRGRFRDYLKTALANLIADHQRRRRGQHQPLAADAPDPVAPSAGGVDPDAGFVASWREELLDSTWNALLQRHPAYHAVLRLRVEQPEMTSAQLAEQLTVELGEPCNAAWVRKTLQRAHDKYAELLVDEVAQSLPVATAAGLRVELQELGLLKYCHSVLQEWKG